MAVNLSIKGVGDDVAARLRLRAERNHRSLQGELMAIVEDAAADSSARPPVAAAEARAAVAWRRTVPEGEARGTKTIEQIAHERRTRGTQPVAGGPLAVDIVRAERDAR
jgi:plasmid stability protein